jgi:hypothetical protein
LAITVDDSGEEFGFVYVSRFVPLQLRNGTKREIEKGQFNRLGSGFTGLLCSRSARRAPRIIWTAG